ncbi:hypothetical protein [Burkholderia phage BCSR5]|nr:hypothetical protein [Burkholderia phage BCSR5]
MTIRVVSAGSSPYYRGGVTGVGIEMVRNMPGWTQVVGNAGDVGAVPLSVLQGQQIQMGVWAQAFGASVKVAFSLAGAEQLGMDGILENADIWLKEQTVAPGDIVQLSPIPVGLFNLLRVTFEGDGNICFVTL